MDYDSLVTVITYCTGLINIINQFEMDFGARCLSLPALKYFKQNSYIGTVGCICNCFYCRPTTTEAILTDLFSQYGTVVGFRLLKYVGVDC